MQVLSELNPRKRAHVCSCACLDHKSPPTPHPSSVSPLPSSHSPSLSCFSLLRTNIPTHTLTPLTTHSRGLGGSDQQFPVCGRCCVPDGTGPLYPLLHFGQLQCDHHIRGQQRCSLQHRPRPRVQNQHCRTDEGLGSQPGQTLAGFAHEPCAGQRRQRHTCPNILLKQLMGADQLSSVPVFAFTTVRYVTVRGDAVCMRVCAGGVCVGRHARRGGDSFGGILNINRSHNTLRVSASQMSTSVPPTTAGASTTARIRRDRSCALAAPATLWRPTALTVHWRRALQTAPAPPTARAQQGTLGLCCGTAHSG